MELKLYNSLSRTKEVFQPLVAPEVKMYLCGPTVYDFLHVGNFRGPIFFSFFKRFLQTLNYKVTLVYNITDIDDRIIDRAKKENKTSAQISEHFTEEFKKDFAAFGLPWPDHLPKVTESMPAIIQMIEKLIENKNAYIVEGGEVFYSIDSFKEYGKLSHRDPQQLLSSVRIERDFKKRNVLDFSLWKPMKPGEPSWPSPWGDGRPGWHIECSAMAHSLLGSTIDIHGGGLDLLFPHHENELAQSEACSHQPFSRFWMHNNMIEFAGAKMSKSLGNVRTARQFLGEYPAEILKFLLNSVHYRSVCDFSDKSVGQAIKSLSKFYSALEKARRWANTNSVTGAPSLLQLSVWKATELELKLIPELSHKAQIHFEKAQEALHDDLNTPEVFAEIFVLTKEFQIYLTQKSVTADQKKKASELYLRWMNYFAELFFIFQQQPEEFLKQLDQKLLQDLGITEAEINDLVEKRSVAKKQKDFGLSDQIRDALVKKGISVMDGALRTTWEVIK